MTSLSKRSRGKVFSILTGVTTVVSLSGLAYFAPLVANAAVPSDYGLKEGWTISAPGSNDPDVYIVNDWGYKRLFLNPVIFNFYGHLGGFAAVHNVTSTVRDAFPTSGLFRNCETNDQAVWAVEVNGEDTGMLHHVVMSGDQAVAQDSNFFKKVFCINNNEANWYSKGSDYTSLSQVPVYSRVPGVTPTPTPTPVSSGLISVSLASDNPAPGTIINGQAAADLLHVMFSGKSVVNSVKLQRNGVSADTSLSNVYLYQGNKRLTDAATVSGGVITFNDSSTNGLFMVSGSTAISVKSDINGTGGETVGVTLTSVNGNAVTVSGNTFTIATAPASFGTIDMSTSVTPSTDAAPTPANDIVGWQDNATIGNHTAWLKSLQLRVIGSVLPGDLQNFRLYVDGTMVGTAVAQPDANGYVVFDMNSNPVSLLTGARTLKVLLNIVNGSSRTYTISLRQKPDILAVDSQYGQPILATGTFPVAANIQTIAKGTLTFTKTPDSPSGDVVRGASGVVLARYDVKAAGESMKVESLNFSIDDSLGGSTAATQVGNFRNGAIFLDGVQVGSTKDLKDENATAAGTQYTFGSSFIVVPGTPRKLEIRADVYDNDTTDNTLAAQTVTAGIEIATSNTQRMTTLTYIDCAYGTGVTGCTAGPIDGNQLTIKTGSMTIGKFTGYANQSVIGPKTGVKLGHWTMTAASSEDVNVNEIDLTMTTGTGTGFNADVSDAYIKVWNDSGTLLYTSATKNSLSDTASNSFATNFVLPKNKTYQVEYWGNLGAGFANTDVLVSAFDASGVTVGSSTTSNVTRVNGQTITGAAGQFTVANGSLAVSNFVNGGQTANAYQFTIQPTYDDYTLDEVYVDITAATAGSPTASQSGAIANLFLKDGSGNVLSTATLTSTGSASFTGLGLSLPQSGGTKTYSVDVQFANVGVGANDTGGSVTVRLDGMKYHNSSGTVTTVTGSFLNSATQTATAFGGNASVDVKGYPTFANVALPSTLLAPGTATLFKATVAATGGQVAWNDLTFTVASNSGAISVTAYKLFENGVDITPSSNANGAAASISHVALTSDRVNFHFATERVVTSATTLELRGTVGAASAGNSLTTQITNAMGTTVTTEDSGTQASAGTQMLTATSIVWTDQSAPAHTTSTDDWFTDGLVKALGISQTLSK